jgi:hypothetical protein
MEDIEVRRERRQENEKMERSSWRYLVGRWIFKISGLVILMYYPMSIVNLINIDNLINIP